jgi:hypothetical protein
MIDMGESFKTWLRNLTTTAGQLAKIFETVGKKIVDGIWSGIKSGWETLKKNFSTAIDDLLKWVESKLKISSPSLVFADEIGAPLALGVAQGFTQTMRRTAGPAMAGSLHGGGMLGGGSTYQQVGTIRVENPLTPGERGWVRREAGNITERTLSRVLRSER